MNTNTLHLIALTLIPGIGNAYARKIISHLGNASELFELSKKDLLSLPRINNDMANGIVNKVFLEEAEQEILFCEKNKIDIRSFLDNNYPKRLKQCEDAPLMLYCKGEDVFNNRRSVSIVGTRRATAYGKKFCEDIVKALKAHNALIVSGLAEGIDTFAHENALKNGLKTIAVLGHPLNTIYPAHNRKLAVEIVNQGTLVTEFPIKTSADKSQFVKRNRIIAGLSDAIIIVESAKKGGALISADFGNSYNRDVFALPGKSTDKYSQGCNNLIKQNKAYLIESIEDLEYIMNWETTSQEDPKLFIELTPSEQLVIDAFPETNLEFLDNLALKTKLPVSSMSSLLLALEFKGAIKALPGKKFQCVL